MRTRRIAKFGAAVVMAATGATSTVLLATAGPAVADPTCYTGCQPAQPATPVQTHEPVSPTSTSGQSGGLPFTGADVAEVAAVAVAAIGLGGIMVNRSRRAKDERTPLEQ